MAGGFERVAHGPGVGDASVGIRGLRQSTIAQRNATPGGSSDAASRTLTGRGLLDTGKSLSFVSDHTNRLRGTPTITGVACGDTCPYNGSVTIDWDPHKAAANIRDHEGVSFAEAATVLNDEFALTREDSDSEGDNDSSLLA